MEATSIEFALDFISTIHAHQIDGKCSSTYSNMCTYTYVLLHIQICACMYIHEYIEICTDIHADVYIRTSCTGWRRLIGSPKLQIIFHKRATKYMSLLRKMTYTDKGSYESSPPCIRSFRGKESSDNRSGLRADSRGTPTARGRQCRMSKKRQEESETGEWRTNKHIIHKSI